MSEERLHLQLSHPAYITEGVIGSVETVYNAEFAFGFVKG